MLKEILPPHTSLAFAAMRELRTGLSSRDDFVEQVDTVQRPAGYRMVGAFPGDGVQAMAVAGFRVNTSLSWGNGGWFLVLLAAGVMAGAGCVIGPAAAVRRVDTDPRALRLGVLALALATMTMLIVSVSTIAYGFTGPRPDPAVQRRLHHLPDRVCPRDAARGQHCGMQQHPRAAGRSLLTHATAHGGPS